jgi:hypothetical protein
VDNYNLSIDGAVQQEGVTEAQASVCLHDLEPHTITVQAFDADGNQGPMSDASDAIQMVIAPPLRLGGPVNPVVRGDFDGDKAVGLSDYGMFVGQLFGKCHDGYTQRECP